MVASFLPNMGNPSEPKAKKQKGTIAPTEPCPINKERQKLNEHVYVATLLPAVKRGDPSG